MLKDFILVIVGLVVFMIPTILQKESSSQRKADFAKQISKTVIISGVFVSLVKLILLISDLENHFGVEGKGIYELSSTAFFIMFFINFRPTLIGILIKLILLLFDRKQSQAYNSKKSEEDFFDPLSSREKEVARLAAKGYSNAQIAEELFISVETVKRHMSTIFEKLGIESRKQLIEKEKI